MAETSARRKNWPLLLGLTALACGGLAQAQGVGRRPPPAPAPPQPQPAAPSEPLFGKWWTVCDNSRACTTYGTGGSRGVALTLVLQRRGEAQAPVRALLVTDPPQKPRVPETWRVLVDGRLIASPRASARDDVMQAVLTPQETAALLAARGAALQVEGVGAGAALSLEGAVSALRQMDEQQGRSGGVTALVSSGPRPLSSVPAPPIVPVVTSRALPAQERLPAAAPGSLRKDLNKCAKALGPPGAQQRSQVFRLDPDTLLWLVPCARDETSDWRMVLLSRADGDKVRPALTTATSPPGLPRGAHQDPRFDPRTGVLTAFETSRGLPDCGRALEWVWTSQGFVQVRERVMSECVGLPMDLWQESYRAETRPGP